VPSFAIGVRPLNSGAQTPGRDACSDAGWRLYRAAIGELELAPNLWAGVGLLRTAGAALVGDANL